LEDGALRTSGGGALGSSSAAVVIND
jgi:hypothetical protein